MQKLRQLLENRTGRDKVALRVSLSQAIADDDSALTNAILRRDPWLAHDVEWVELAVTHKTHSTIQILAKYRAPVSSSALNSAVFQNDTIMLHSLVRLDTVNLRDILYPTLIWLVSTQRVATIYTLLSSYKLETWVLEKLFLDIIRLEYSSFLDMLLIIYPNQKFPRFEGLCIAIRLQSCSCVQILVEHGVDIFANDCHVFTIDQVYSNNLLLDNLLSYIPFFPNNENIYCCAQQMAYILSGGNARINIPDIPPILEMTNSDLENLKSVCYDIHKRVELAISHSVLHPEWYVYTQLRLVEIKIRKCIVHIARQMQSVGEVVMFFTLKNPFFVEVACFCMESFDPESQVVTLPCRHVFHSECIRQWMRMDKHTCPVCRASFL